MENEINEHISDRKQAAVETYQLERFDIEGFYDQKNISLIHREMRYLASKGAVRGKVRVENPKSVSDFEITIVDPMKYQLYSDAWQIHAGITAKKENGLKHRDKQLEKIAEQSLPEENKNQYESTTSGELPGGDETNTDEQSSEKIIEQSDSVGELSAADKSGSSV